MKLKISESKIRQVVNEEVLRSSLNKTMAEQKWPNYSAYLLAEVLKLEWENTLTESTAGQKPSPEWIAETANAFGLSDAEIQEATDIMNNDELEEGIGGFFKAIAKPYQNIWKTFTNITQHAANFTDPEKKKAAATVDQIDDQMPDPKELGAQVQQASSGGDDELQAYLRKIIALLSKVDDAVDLDAIKPGMEDQADQSFDAIEDVAGQVVDDPSLAGGGAGAEGGGGEAFVYKGKGGKGLQSFLARGSKEAGVKGLKGKAMGAVLKHIEKQLKAQGVTVSEGVLDEVQGWMWYGLVEDMMQEQYGQKVLISDILEELNEKRSGKGGSKNKGRGSRGGRKRRNAKAQRPSGGMSSSSGKERARASAQRDNDTDRLSQSANAKKGMRQRARGEEPAAEDPAAAAAAEVEALPGAGESDAIGAGDVPGGEVAAPGEEPAAEAPIEPVKPTVKNTAPEGSATIKVFKGKGGEGLQSALAKNRDALGIDQQTVAVIIKSVEQWANANQIKVENVSADVFNTIISEISTKYKTRRLKETVQKLKNV